MLCAGRGWRPEPGRDSCENRPQANPVPIHVYPGGATWDLRQDTCVNLGPMGSGPASPPHAEPVVSQGHQDHGQDLSRCLGPLSRPVSLSPSAGPFTPLPRSRSTSPAQGKSRPRAFRTCRRLCHSLAFWASRPEGPGGELARRQDHPHSRAAEPPARVRPLAAAHLTDGGWGYLVRLPLPRPGTEVGAPWPWPRFHHCISGATSRLRILRPET